jgi:hypothetical protein
LGFVVDLSLIIGNPHRWLPLQQISLKGPQWISSVLSIVLELYQLEVMVGKDVAGGRSGEGVRAAV